MFEKYKNCVVKFTGYYKYTFTFMTTLQNGNTLIVQIGGCPDSIYTFAVSPDMIRSINSLDPYMMMEITHAGEVVEVWKEKGDF